MGITSGTHNSKKMSTSKSDTRRYDPLQVNLIPGGPITRKSYAHLTKTISYPITGKLHTRMNVFLLRHLPALLPSIFATSIVVPFTTHHNENCNQNYNHIHKWYGFRVKKITIGLITTIWVVIEGNIVRSSPQMVLLGVLEELLKMAMYLEPVLRGRNSERLRYTSRAA